MKTPEEPRDMPKNTLEEHLPEYAQATDTGWRCTECGIEFMSLRWVKEHRERGLCR
jgi:hypothetical protein